MRRRKREDPSLFYIQVHAKHFSTARTVNRPTIDIVRGKGRGKKREPERMRLMFPRTMQVLQAEFKVKSEPCGIPLCPDPRPMLFGEPQQSLSARVRIVDWFVSGSSLPPASQPPR